MSRLFWVWHIFCFIYFIGCLFIIVDIATSENIDTQNIIWDQYATAQPHSYHLSQVACNPDSHAVGGGYQTTFPEHSDSKKWVNKSYLQVTDSYPSPATGMRWASPARSWTVRVWNGTDLPHKYRIYVACKEDK